MVSYLCTKDRKAPITSLLTDWISITVVSGLFTKEMKYKEVWPLRSFWIDTQSAIEDFDPYDNWSFRLFTINWRSIKLPGIEVTTVLQILWLPKLQERKARRKPERQRQLLLTERRRGEEREGKAMLSTSTKCWSKFTLTLVSPAKPWASWTRSSTTFSSASLPKLPALPTTTRNRPSAPVRSRLRSGCFCPANWRNTPSVKEQRLWPSTLAASKLTLWVSRQNKRLF